MDFNIKQELIDKIQQFNIKKEEEDFEFIMEPIKVFKCAATTMLTLDVKVDEVNDDAILVTGDGVTHKFLHGLKRYNVTSLRSKIRVVLKGMVMEEVIDDEDSEYYSFDLKLEFTDKREYEKFLVRLGSVGYNDPVPQQ
ncbi:hypothetical protein M3Y98_00869900 [Aphelenchoides besseyi]|nr:hypothetical protein M3Y98_00869900 [Aphelenchoides besseyi]